MNKQEFSEYLQKGMILLDGATGSNLQKKGLSAGECVEQWVCGHKEILIGLQREYVEAGSRIIYAPTFGANRMKLKEFGLDGETVSLNRELVAIAKKAVGGQALVAGDVTMTGQQLEPLGTLGFEELIDIYKEQMTALEQAGADCLIVETMMSLQETRAALIAAKEAVQLPVMVTMSFSANGKTLYGTDAGTAAVVFASLGAAAVGMNCSAGPDQMTLTVRKMKEAVNVPIIAKPNAGMPKLGAGGVTEYDMDAETFAEHMLGLVKEGAVLLGGCCGTDPSYIQALRQKLSDYVPQSVPDAPSAIYITSERNAVEWKAECTIGQIGTYVRDEINEEWEEDCYDTLYDSIDEQVDEEADALCICVDACEGDRSEIMRRVISETTAYTALPLIFRTRDAQVLETALRVYPGRSAVLAEEGQEELLKETADKYGAVWLKA